MAGMYTIVEESKMTSIHSGSFFSLTSWVQSGFIVSLYAEFPPPYSWAGMVGWSGNLLHLKK